MAVLGAAPGLERDDALDLDLVAAPPHPHLVGEVEQLVDPLVGQAQRRQRLRLGKADALLQPLGPRRLENDHLLSHRATNAAASNVPPNRGATAARTAASKSSAVANPAGSAPTRPYAAKSATLHRS